MGLINQYPYTNFQEVNLDYIIKLCRENMGLHLEVNGQTLLLKTADGRIISNITVPYASEAGSAATATQANYAATAGTAAQAQYAATAGSATTASSATEATHAATADLATSATSAATATNATYATTAGSATNATNAVNAQNATYAESTGSVEHAQKAFETLGVSGDKIKLTAYDGTSQTLNVPYAVKTYYDYLTNPIHTTYIANVVNDNGVLKFKNAQGGNVVSITPTTTQATEDDYGNNIADFVKTITAPSDSNYVTVSHGTGTAETITINYSNAAWKDTNGNVIKNYYVGSLEIVQDDQTGHYNLVAYNGDTPKAELFRFEVNAYSAQTAAEADHATRADYATNAGTAQTADKASNGDVITEYAKSFERSADAGNQNLVIKDGDGNTLQTINLFNAANMYIKFKDQDPLSPLNPFDATFTVNHSEEYEIENLAYWGWDDFRLHFNNVGIQYRYADENGVVKMQSPGAYYTDAGYLFQLYDATADAIKVFKVEGGNAANTMILTRLK